DRAVMVVADPRPLHGDLAEGGFEGEGSCPPALDARTGFAVPVLEHEFLIGLLDQDLEEPALDFETGLMNVRLDLVGEMLVLLWHGQGHLQRQLQRERLSVWLDGAEGDGSLKVVGGTHGVSPYWHYGGPSCVLFYQSSMQSRSPRAESRQKILPLSCASFPLSRTSWRALGDFGIHVH